MAVTNYIMGTLFAAVVAFLIFLSFSRGLSPVIVGAGILVTLILWYLVNGADVEPPNTSTSSADNRTPSNSSPSGGPDLDGPDLGGGNGGNNNGGANNGGGSSNDPIVEVEIETKTGQPPEEGIKSSDMIFEFDITDQSGSGLDMMEIKLDQHPPVDDDLGGQANVKSATPFNMLFGVFGLRQGSHPYEVKVRDNQGNTTIFQDSFPVSNKNSGGQNNSMPDFDELEKDLAALDENDLPKAINALKNHHEHLKAEEELSDRLFNDAKDFLEHIHTVRQDLIDLENNNLTQKQSRQELQDLHDHLEEALRDLRDFEELVESEKTKVNEDSQLLAKLENAEDAIEPKMNYLQNHQRDLKQAIGT